MSDGDGSKRKNSYSACRAFQDTNLTVSSLENIVDCVHELLLNMIGGKWVVKFYVSGLIYNFFHPD